MAKFEKVSRFAEVDINLPQRKTAESAGYDMEVAEDIIIPSYHNLMDVTKSILSPYMLFDDGNIQSRVLSLNDIAEVTKLLNAKPTLVPTGMKCKLEPGTYLELSVRSSCPLKYWLILANSVGIIDGDYYNNPDNEGEIFFQMINLSPFDIRLNKGDIIGQGIIKPYLTTEDDDASGERMGGFGSTSV
jgi:dUTP pyrophosphatase